MPFAADTAAQIARLSIQLLSIWPMFIVMETLWPKTGPRFVWRLKGLKFSVVYVVATGAIFAGVNLGLSAWHARPLLSPLLGIGATPLKGLEAAALTLGAALLADFLYYWCHRAQHRFFWRFHAVHHAIGELSAVNAYMHWTEELVRLPFITLPMALLLPLDAGAGVPLITNLVVLHSYYLHSQTRLHLGPVAYLISDNRFHRIHHSTEPAHWDKNFGVLTPIWDWVFGTAYFPRKDEWPEVGVRDLNEVDSVFEYLIRPFRPMPTDHAPDAPQLAPARSGAAD